MTGPGEVEGRTLSPGRAEGRALVLEEPLSLWGGMDAGTGLIVDAHHPQRGEPLTGRVLVMPSGKGSSSSSSVLAEAIRAGTAPAAILLAESDPILAIGAMVAEELYGRGVPVAVLPPAAYRTLRTGLSLAVEAGNEGTIVRRAARGRPRRRSP